MKSLTIGKATLAALFVVSSVTMASAQYMYAPYQGATRYNVPTEQQHWYDRNAAGINV